ncbi:MAG: radical SAM protein [Geobacteraceae bacterium]|nr:radical SAM protein [Geobacteraceae bacterium]
MRRITKLAYRVVRSNLAELTYPYRLTFAVTSRCQARCIMCNIWQKPVENELSLEEIDRIFSRYTRFSWINLTGGEPFMRDDFTDIVRVIARRSPDLYLLNFPTNGYLTDLIVTAVREILDRMAIPRLMVTVSLDGPPELHDRIRNLPGSWDRALATFQQLRELRSRRFAVFLGYTVQSANLQAFDDMMAAARSRLGDLSADDVHVNLAHVSGHYYANSGFTGIPDPEEAGRLLDRVSAARKQRLFDPVAFLERNYQRMARSYRRSGFVPLTCQAAAASCFIDPEGTVFPCSGFAAPIGSLRENDCDLYRVWHGPARCTVRNAVRDGACPGCWTPCEAYQTILANLLPGRSRHQ